MFLSKRKKEPTLVEQLADFKPVFAPSVMITQAIDYRPCYVNGRRALFHRWITTARPQLPKGQEPGENARYFQFRSTHGLVEYEDGTVDKVWPHDIKFADGGHFEDYAWQPADQQEGDHEGR